MENSAARVDCVYDWICGLNIHQGGALYSPSVILSVYSSRIHCNMDEKESTK